MNISVSAFSHIFPISRYSSRANLIQYCFYSRSGVSAGGLQSITQLDIFKIQVNAKLLPTAAGFGSPPCCLVILMECVYLLLVMKLFQLQIGAVERYMDDVLLNFYDLLLYTRMQHLSWSICLIGWETIYAFLKARNVTEHCFQCRSFKVFFNRYIFIAQKRQ